MEVLLMFKSIILMKDVSTDMCHTQTDTSVHSYEDTLATLHALLSTVTSTERVVVHTAGYRLH